jgi:DNA-binding LacI/PurR family transcriptional regulator
MIDMRHRLTEEGHQPFYTDRTLQDLGMEVPRVARLVEQTAADAWIVIAGSREVLKWFAEGGAPAFALFGRRHSVPLAGSGPDKAPAYAAAARALLDLGHRRIVLLALARQRLPRPGKSERAFLAELEARGIAPAPYHLPEWEETVEGFQARLDALFRTTPPTALVIDSVPLFAAAQQFLGGRGLRVPEDVSIISTDHSETFWWCCPPITHIRWDSRPVVRRAVHWAAGIAGGKADRRQISYPAEFVPGGTIGPAPGE